MQKCKDIVPHGNLFSKPVLHTDCCTSLHETEYVLQVVDDGWGTESSYLERLLRSIVLVVMDHFSTKLQDQSPSRRSEPACRVSP